MTYLTHLSEVFAILADEEASFLVHRRASDATDAELAGFILDIEGMPIRRAKCRKLFTRLISIARSEQGRRIAIAAGA